MLNKSFILLGTMFLFCLTGCFGKLNNPTNETTLEKQDRTNTNESEPEPYNELAEVSGKSMDSLAQENQAKNMSTLESCLENLEETYHKAYGEGTAENPYLLCTESQFVSLSNNSEDFSFNYSAQRNFDFTGYSFNIGTIEAPFAGAFYGNNYTFSNYSFDEASKDNVGFFGVLNKASIENINFENAYVNAAMNVGVLFGVAVDSQISGVVSTGDVAGNTNVGGIGGAVITSDISEVSSTAGVLGSFNVNQLIGFYSQRSLTKAVENTNYSENRYLSQQ